MGDVHRPEEALPLNRFFWLADASRPLSLPSPARGEGVRISTMFEKLSNAGERLASDAVAQAITRLANTPTPIGVAAGAIEGGVSLTGKGLRRRMIDNPQLRNFGK